MEVSTYDWTLYQQAIAQAKKVYEKELRKAVTPELNSAACEKYRKAQREAFAKLKAE